MITGAASFIKLFRIKAWWGYIPPPVMASLYFGLIKAHMPYSDSIALVLMILASTLSTAFFGFFLNDVTDSKEDKLAGKENHSEKLPVWLKIILLLVFSAVGFLPWVFISHNGLSLILVPLQFLLLILYSLPPQRLKRFPLAAVLLDSLYSGLLFTLAVLFLFQDTLATIEFSFWMLMIFIFSFWMRGLRNILNHQAADAEFDKNIGYSTFVSKYGASRTKQIILYLLFPVELVLIAALNLFLSFVLPYFYLSGLFFTLYVLTKLADTKKVKTSYPGQTTLLNDYYEDLIPLTFLVYLSLTNPLFWYLAIAHCVLFKNKIAVRLIYDILYRKIILWFYYKMFCNKYAKEFYKKIGCNVKESKVENSSEVLENYNSTRLGNPVDYVCYAPFKNMYFNITGMVSPCWLTLTAGDMYPEKSLKEIWLGNTFETIRNNIRNADLSQNCMVCSQKLKAHQYHNILSRAYDNNYPLSEYPVVLELELDNTCNLECIMCTDMLSSSIRKNREKKEKWISPYDDTFFEQLKEIVPYLEEIRFNGGEPFLSELCYKIWNYVIEMKPSIKLVVATNGTVLNERVRNVLSGGRFSINFSMDSIQKDTYEQIRKNSHFDEVIENLHLFRNYCDEKKTDFCILFNPLRENSTEIPGFVAFCNQHKMPLFFNTIISPYKHALWTLEEDELQEIFDSLSKFSVSKPSGRWPDDDNAEKFYQLVNNDISNWLNMSKLPKPKNLPQTDSETEILFYNSIYRYLALKNKGNEDASYNDLLLMKEKLEQLFVNFRDETTKENFLEKIQLIHPEILICDLLNKANDDLYVTFSKIFK